MIVYVIPNWKTMFENNRTKEIKSLSWVPIPNKHDSDGFTELMDHPRGMSHYGAWIVIVQIASKCGVRGTLLRDGGKPHTPQSLARMSHGSAAVFEEAIPRLIELGWLCEKPCKQSCCEIPQEGAAIPHAPNVPAAEACDPIARALPSPPVLSEGGMGETCDFAELPSESEIEGYCATIGLPPWRAMEEHARMMERRPPWHEKGQRVDWRQRLKRVKTWWEQDGRPKQGQMKNANGKRNTQPDRNAGTANEGKASQYAGRAKR